MEAQPALAAAAPPTFEVGDLVKLKGGGPPMVIESIDSSDNWKGEGLISCIWFDLDDTTGRWRGPFRENFKRVLLVGAVDGVKTDG